MNKYLYLAVPYPAWSKCCLSSCRNELNFGPRRTNWIASKKLLYCMEFITVWKRTKEGLDFEIYLFPLPFRPTITLCCELHKGSICIMHKKSVQEVRCRTVYLKASISFWLLNDRNPDMVTSLICITEACSFINYNSRVDVDFTSEFFSDWKNNAKR